MIPRIAIGAVLALVLGGGCSTKSTWQFVRERPRQKTITEVTVRTTPDGADVFLNGSLLGQAPLVVPVKYGYVTRHYQRRNAVPYPHVEDKEVRTYENNEFVFEARKMGHVEAQKELVLNGEENVEISIELPGKVE